MLRRKDHGRGHAAWNLRPRPILHFASYYISMGSVDHVPLLHDPMRSSRNGNRS